MDRKNRSGATLKYTVSHFQMIKKLLLFLTLFAFFACGSNTDDGEPALDPLTGETYFFLREGKFREYQVYEIRYLAVDISDTLRYQIREEVKGSFTNGSGDVSNLIHRFSRLDESREWELDSVWSARVIEQQAISVENNVPFVKIEFPPLQERKWNGNRFNNKGSDAYEVIRFSPLQDEENTTVFTVPALPGENSVTPTFTEVLVIEQHNDEDNITFRDMRTEVYKDSIGLVYKFSDVVKICSRPECLGLELVESGRLYREVLINEGSLDDD